MSDADLLRQFVPLKSGAPSHDTFSRVLGRWTRRRSTPPSPAFSQVVAEAGGEAQAATEALKLLSLKGCTVTGG